MAAAAGAAALLAVAGSGAHPSDDAGQRLLPDLVQILPPEVHVAHARSARRGRRTLLTFAAAAENHGDGPLIVRASRPNRRTGTMTATQIVKRADGTRERVASVGRLRFVRSADHRHWHFLDFMRYELRTLGGERLGRDQKTGFCLGDRYDSDQLSSFPNEPREPVFTSQCGRNDRRRLSVREGISVGYGDDYLAFLEGQYIDITGVRSGRYVLVQRVNPRGHLLDLHADNDVSSALLRIRRHGRRTRARIVRYCTSTDRCPPRR